jgi:hypothetical protein
MLKVRFPEHGISGPQDKSLSRAEQLVTPENTQQEVEGSETELAVRVVPRDLLVRLLGKLKPATCQPYIMFPMQRMNCKAEDP